MNRRETSPESLTTNPFHIVHKFQGARRKVCSTTWNSYSTTWNGCFSTWNSYFTSWNAKVYYILLVLFLLSRAFASKLKFIELTLDLTSLRLFVRLTLKLLHAFLALYLPPVYARPKVLKKAREPLWTWFVWAESVLLQKICACIEVLRHLDTPETRTSRRTSIPIGSGKTGWALIQPSRKYQWTRHEKRIRTNNNPQAQKHFPRRDVSLRNKRDKQ